MLTVIENKIMVGPDELKNGRWLLDKECAEADVHYVVRELRAGEDPYDAWNEQRSDDGVVVEVDGDAARVLMSM